MKNIHLIKSLVPLGYFIHTLMVENYILFWLPVHSIYNRPVPLNTDITLVIPAWGRGGFFFFRFMNKVPMCFLVRLRHTGFSSMNFRSVLAHTYNITKEHKHIWQGDHKSVLLKLIPINHFISCFLILWLKTINFYAFYGHKCL